MPAARSESWFGPAVCAGTAGKDCEPDDDFAWQHGILQPCWQQAGSGRFAEHGGGVVCAHRSGVIASTKLQTMAKAHFIVAILTLFGFSS